MMTAATAFSRTPGRRRAIVHLGPQKTGTTAIRKWLTVNAPALADHGFHFDPFDDTNRSPVEHGIVVAMIALGDAIDMAPARRARKLLGIKTHQDHVAAVHRLEDLFKTSLERAGDRTVILSSEFLSGWAHNQSLARRICRFMHRHFDEILYVAYIREQADWLTSVYIQSNRTGTIRTPEDFLAERSGMDYAAYTEKWTSAIGHTGRLCLRLFDRETLVDQNAIADFAAVCGIDTTDLQQVPRSNESLTARQIRVVQALFRMEQRFGREDAVSAGKKLRLARLFGGGTAFGFSPDQIAHIRASHAEANEAFRAAYFPERPVLFSNLLEDSSRSKQTQTTARLSNEGIS
ncbi:MAG: hypothetical protein AAF727_15590 [Pseudomonadota bacterium]